MTIKQNKAYILGWTEAINQRDWETAMAKYFKPAEFEEFKVGHREFRKSFPDYHITAETIVGEGNLVAVLFTVSGTHSAEFPYAELKGIPASGKHLEWHEAVFFRFENGELVDWQGIIDNYNRLVQLGVYD